MKESWETTSPWPTSSRCGHARAPCISRTTRKREEDTWANAYRPGGYRGEEDHGRDPGGPGRGTGDAGTACHHPGEGDRSDSMGLRDGDGGPGTRTTGTVPSPRNSGGRTS